MSRQGRKTPLEQRWPDTPDFMEVARAWKSDASAILLSFVWQAYDLLQNEILMQIDWKEANEQLERSITQLLEPAIHDVMTRDEPFYVQYEVFEFETRESAQARPPQYDIAFVLYSNRRIMWPLEAKVLRTDGTVAPYIKDLKKEFLTCRYAPFSSEGAMLGYLISGKPANVFHHLETKVPCELYPHPEFPDRDHRCSEHLRHVPANKPYLAHFRCHHVILRMKTHLQKFV